jgi:SprT protein
MKKELIEENFKQFVPKEFASYCADLLLHYKVKMTITKERNSKNGDYRPPLRKGQHEVTVNHNLNPYLFLLVYVHEMAHVKTWEDYKNKALPHGMEWKKNFKLMTLPILESGNLPSDIQAALVKFFVKTPATFIADTHLTKVLKRYDTENITFSSITLDNIPLGTKFKLKNGLAFEKKERLRTWYLCRELRTDKIYRVKGNAEIQVLD